MAPPRHAVKCAARGGMTKGEVVAAVFERDKYRCVKCGMTNDEHQRRTGRSLQVHRLEPGKMYRVETCSLRCQRCHLVEPKRERGTVDEENPVVGFLVRLPESYREMFHRLKAKTDIPIAAMIRRAVDAFLEQNGKVIPHSERRGRPPKDGSK